MEPSPHAGELRHAGRVWPRGRRVCARVQVRQTLHEPPPGTPRASPRHERAKPCSALTPASGGGVPPLHSFGRGGSACDPADIVLQRARNELGSIGIDLFHVKCEQFVHLCKTGNAPSAARPVRPTLPTHSPGQSTKVEGARSPAPVWPSARARSSSAGFLSPQMQRLSSNGGGTPPLLRCKSAGLDASPSTRIATKRESGEPADVLEGGGVPSLGGSDTDAPRWIEGATRPRKEVAAVALGAGFEVYGACRGSEEAARQKRANLLRVLQSRSIVYADADACKVANELLLSFLDGHGYGGAGYLALRAHSQRKLAQTITSALEYTAGPLAIVDGGQPLLVPLSRRLAKKVGDLLQLCFLLFDWQPSSTGRGMAHTHGQGDLAHFASDLCAVLRAFAHGMVFDAASTAPLAAPGSSAGSAGAGAELAPLPEDTRRQLHKMRLLVAALHGYLRSCIEPSASPPPCVSSGAGGGEAPPAEATTIGCEPDGRFCSGVRERLSLALARGPRSGVSDATCSSAASDASSGAPDAERTARWDDACEFERAFTALRADTVPMDMLHALCRADLYQQAVLASVRAARGEPLPEPPLVAHGVDGGGQSGALAAAAPAPAQAAGSSGLDDEEDGGLYGPMPGINELMEAMLLPLRPAPSAGSSDTGQLRGAGTVSITAPGASLSRSVVDRHF